MEGLDHSAVVPLCLCVGLLNLCMGGLRSTGGNVPNYLQSPQKEKKRVYQWRNGYTVSAFILSVLKAGLHEAVLCPIFLGVYSILHGTFFGT